MENETKKEKELDPLGRAAIKSVQCANVFDAVVLDGAGGFYLNITTEHERNVEALLKIHLAALVRLALMNDQWLEESLQMLMFANKSGLSHKDAVRNAHGSFMLRALGIDITKKQPPEPPEEKPRIHVV